MSKRVATKQLTMDNFDEDDDEVDYEDNDSAGGVVRVASDEVLKTRPMAKARRRSDLNSSVTGADDGSDAPKKSAFSGFGGFKGLQSNALKPTASSLDAFKAFASTPTSQSAITSTANDKPVSQTSSTVRSGQTNGADNEDEDMDESDAEYDRQLSKLNKCFFNHMKTYLDKSYSYNFTPVCLEYIQYHKQIESEAKTNGAKTTQVPTGSAWPVKSLSITNNFGTDSTPSLPSTPDSSQASTTGALFGSETSSTDGSLLFAKPGGLQFGLSKPSFTNPGFSIPDFLKGGAGSQSSTVTADSANDEESEEPPKVESVEHTEPNAVFTKKCKLYFKKENNWIEKGIGFLYIIKDEKASKPQLLIRASNTMGTILLHITLSESLPVGKAPQNKGVLLTCIPHPPLDPKAAEGSQTSVSFMIRVNPKSTDEVFNALVKHMTN
ncbi:unnamed protein product [Oppiella nova]|uniref:RanBD1 domain-containing protein n=1 Tax=Oppiella nova TaxID=334625 RepID=A0A7R9QWP1_9ACAR|nr:unnamed protein product [Oppiella nova]CAG2177148.1 unnamed protein product [Oppiella nova]